MKKKLLSLLICVFILLLSACGTSDSSSAEAISSGEPEPSVENTFDLDKYTSLVSECRASINEASLYVANTGTYEYNYWKALGSLSDAMSDSAFEWLSKNSEATRESVDADYDNIRQQYKDIILIEIEGQEAEEIDTAFRSMYDAYISMYALVTSPSGTLSSFATQLNDYIGTITRADEDLSLFLD